jgi:G3E family GTPase
MPDPAMFVPVSVVTGFLGSGKTTLLKRLLDAPALRDTAVLVNEFGEVGLDHHLLRRLDDDIVLLQSGCLCCTIRGDLSAALRDLYSRRERGEVAFRRVAIETTGLADPVPILATVMAEPVLRHHFRLGNVITTVDAINGDAQLDDHPESLKQAAVADRIVVTKTDIAGSDRVAALRRRLGRLNPGAQTIDAAPGLPLDAELLLTRDRYDPASKRAEIRAWLAAEMAASAGHEAAHDRHDVNRHDAAIHAFCLTFAQPLDWTLFGIWLTMLLHCRGADILRVKGLLNVGEGVGPVVINGVQHLVHPPEHLAEWPDADRRSRIVFIVRGIAQGSIERSLAAFNRLAAKQAEHT